MRYENVPPAPARGSENRALTQAPTFPTHGTALSVLWFSDPRGAQGSRPGDDGDRDRDGSITE